VEGQIYGISSIRAWVHWSLSPNMQVVMPFLKFGVKVNHWRWKWNNTIAKSS